MHQYQPEHITWLRRVTAEYLLVRQEYREWYGREARRRAEAMNELLLGVARNAGTCIYQVGDLLLDELQLSEQEELFALSCDQDVHMQLDARRRFFHASIMGVVGAIPWPQYALDELDAKLTLRAQQEYRSRVEFIAFTDMIRGKFNGVYLLQHYKAFAELNQQLREFHEILCDKRAHIAVLSIPTPLSPSTEEPR